MNRPNESTDPSIDCGSDTLAHRNLWIEESQSGGGTNDPYLQSIEIESTPARWLTSCRSNGSCPRPPRPPPSARRPPRRTRQSAGAYYVLCVIDRGRWTPRWVDGQIETCAACWPPPSLHQSLRGPHRPTHRRAPAVGSHSHADVRGPQRKCPASFRFLRPSRSSSPFGGRGRAGPPPGRPPSRP